MNNTAKNIVRINEQLTALTSSYESIAKAIADYVKEDQDFIHKYCETYPEYTTSFMYRMLAVGKGEMNAQLAIMNGAAANKLRYFPRSLQDKYVKSNIPVAVKVDGEFKTELKPINNLTSREAAYVFDSVTRKVRTPEAQIKYQQANPIAVDKPRYNIFGDKISFYAYTEFTLAQLEDIVSKMRAKVMPQKFNTLQSQLQRNQVRA